MKRWFASMTRRQPLWNFYGGQALKSCARCAWYSHSCLSLCSSSIVNASDSILNDDCIGIVIFTLGGHIFD
jgi:hypothetical protein